MVIDIYRRCVNPVLRSQATKNSKRENPRQRKTNQTRPMDSFSSVLERKIQEDLTDRV